METPKTDRVEQDKYMIKLGVITAYRLWITEQNAKVSHPTEED